ncbi:hypothetical protein [Alkalicoccobacillus gibsonii]|uniref:hypothetical protein n=1 Tax=Alkalicoccobacillus gibsonii TaxID=79881 RepID=UPI001A3F9E54|nr:hypothetical protein [Alkalicoccobacillus gibsonii]MBM0064953.1 hypothetical protein [Alkalicoccobacillus gibsonii]
MMKFKVRKKFDCIFESKTEDELIYVKYEDLDGYIHYEYSSDGANQDYTMTPIELYRDYKRLIL